VSPQRKIHNLAGFGMGKRKDFLYLSHVGVRGELGLQCSPAVMGLSIPKIQTNPLSVRNVVTTIEISVVCFSAYSKNVRLISRPNYERDAAD
jgi:hypothetical protein